MCGFHRGQIMLVSFIDSLAFDTKYWYRYQWTSIIDTSIGISISEAQVTILVLASVLLKKYGIAHYWFIMTRSNLLNRCPLPNPQTCWHHTWRVPKWKIPFLGLITDRVYQFQLVWCTRLEMCSWFWCLFWSLWFWQIQITQKIKTAFNINDSTQMIHPHLIFY